MTSSAGDSRMSSMSRLYAIPAIRIRAPFSERFRTFSASTILSTVAWGIAAFTLALLAGGTPEEAAIIANTAAGIVVMKYGTATVGPKDLTAALRVGELT